MHISRKAWKHALVLSAVLAGVGIALIAFLLADLPGVEGAVKGVIYPSTIIYDRRGRLLYEISDPRVGRHDPLPLDTIPVALQQATIATEDSRFYSNPGVDAWAIVRALWINVRGGEVISGGSTITQQLARNLLLTPAERAERTLWRKLRESVLAFRLARTFSKERILELYLNQTDYGSMAIGVQAAARTYFGKPVQELDLAECALLAGLPQGPSLYNPLVDPGAAQGRQRVVLDLMVKAGYISAADAELAATEELALAPLPFPIRAPHFVMYVWDILRREYGDQALYRDGLRVHTTLDIDLQDRAQELVRLQLERLQHPMDGGPSHNASNAAVVMLDPANGDILVMSGSADYFDPAIDGAVNVALMPRQPGSAIKPLTYAAAFSKGLSPATMMLDVPMSFTTREGDAYAPVNYDGQFRGPVLLREALGSSLNVVAVQVLQYVGVEGLVALAQDLGMTTLRDPERYGLALTLGGGEVRLLELTAAYAAFARNGLAVPTQAIMRIEDSTGKAIWEPEVRPDRRVLSDDVAYWINDVLSDDSARIAAFGEGSILALTRPAAVKTGTTTDWRDNWAVGYTPDLVTGVWVGNADNSPMLNVSGISGAAPIWHHVMDEALKGRPELAFAAPPDWTGVTICADSGLLPSELCPHLRRESFPSGRQPTAVCNMHLMVHVNAETGTLADGSTPVEKRRLELGWVLPETASQWIEQQNRRASGPLYLIETEASDAIGTAVPHITLTEPENGAVYRISTGLPADSQRIAVRAMLHNLPARTQVRIYIDGEEIREFDEGPYEYYWTLQAGGHQFQAQAQDPSENTWSSAVVEITVLPS